MQFTMILQNPCVCLFGISSVFVLVRSQADPSPVVTTDLGAIRGTTHQVLGRSVNAFLGIPYAQPPLGRLRFRRPEPITEPWADAFDAKELPYACPQDNNTALAQFDTDLYTWALVTKADEDCLKLNIWAPSGAVNAPVMIWIHGGGFMFGSAAGKLNDGRYLAAKGDVVFVAMNYRLGTFGFLYFDDDSAPGNVGLWDQNLAVKWVHDNIRAFGGDPDKITLFGESAGGDSVNLHLMSRQPKHFHNAIIHSPSPPDGYYWLSPDAAIQRSYKYARTLGCTQTELQEILECMRGIKMEVIIETFKYFYYEALVPTLDGDFLTSAPKYGHESLERDMNFIIGSNENEGYMTHLLPLYPELFFSPEKPTIPDEDFTKMLSQLTAINNTRSLRHMTALYRHIGDNLDILDAMMGDLYYGCPTSSFALAYQAHPGNNVHLYRMKHRSSASAWPEWTGVLHWQELDLVFGFPLDVSRSYSQEERDLSSAIIDYWTNLAKSGSPNTDDTGSWATDVEWPQYKENEKKHLIFNTRSEGGIRVGHALRERQCQFWEKIFPGLLEKKQLRDLLKAHGMQDLSRAHALSTTMIQLILAVCTLVLGLDHL